MEATPVFFRDLAYVFVAAVAGGMLAWRLRQPVIIGYVLAGILISPLTPGPSVQNVHTLELFAEIGVILLMFSIGLEFSLKDLLHAKWTALLGGPLGILLSIGLTFAVGRLLGWTTAQSLAVGAIVSVASTMVLTRLLLDQGQLHTTAGRLMLAIALVEDLAVVVLVLLLPSLARFDAGHLWSVSRELGRAALILAPTLLIGAKVVPPVLKHVARTQRRELFFIVVLAICLGTAALTQAMGLSLALGAFVAGIIISGSEYAHEAMAHLFPLRDSFVALFFVTLGLLVDPHLLLSNLSIAAIMVALILFGNFAVWTAVVRVFGHPIWMALTVAAGLTQIGEFSFLLVRVARNSGIVSADVYNATLAASLLTILVNAALVRFIPGQLVRLRIARHGLTFKEERREEILANHVVLCGFGRVGSAVGAALETFQVRYVVIEIDPDISTALRMRGIPCIFGDAAHPHILDRAFASAASLVIVTLPDADRARVTIASVRRANAKVPILARAHGRPDYEILIRAGATEIIQPELEASATVIRHAFSYLRFPDERVRTYLRGFREAMDVLQEKPPISAGPVPEVRAVTLADSSLVGRSLREARLREQYGVSVVAISRLSGEILLDPPADTILLRYDVLRLVGLTEQIQALVEATSADKRTPPFC